MRDLLNSCALVALCVLAGVSIAEALHSPLVQPSGGPERAVEWVTWEVPPLERMITEGEK
jgi:hypothetical protein